MFDVFAIVPTLRSGCVIALQVVLAILTTTAEALTPVARTTSTQGDSPAHQARQQRRGRVLRGEAQEQGQAAPLERVARVQEERVGIRLSLIGW